ncbi:type I polyketide synthase, partial [Frankia sp. Cj3]|uniref:type I polyketide synthase n=3 Tax=unclassified Frankia TaxID=2632575 RepID=UPI001EF41A4E
MNEGDQRTDRRLAKNPIAVIGLAGLFPMAHNFREYWQNVVDAADCTQEVPPTHWQPADYYDPDPAAPDKTYSKRGGFVPEMAFSPMEFGFPPNLLPATGVVQLLSLLVARDVLRDAGAPDSSWYDPTRTGVTLGVTGPMPMTHPMAARLETPVLKEVVRSCGLSAADAEAIAAKFALAFPAWEENSFPGLLGNVTAGRIANRLDLGGSNYTVDAACASALAAVKMAVSELVEERADLMITGGCDTENTLFGFMCFSKTQALSRTDTIRPFDDSADGTLVGEGIGMLALKRLADAERDGDRVYAVIRGIGASSDGRFKSIYAPRAEGQVIALQRAYEDAGCEPSTVELVEAHATGTKVGDRTELTALHTVMGTATREKHFAAIGSVKSQIGHTKGAAGAAALIKLALSLHHRVLPPTINVERPNSAVDFDNSPFYINTRTRPWIRDPRRPRRRAAASAMGFGGTNFHVVLEEGAPDRAGLRTMHQSARAYVWHAPRSEDLFDLLRAAAPPNADGEIPADHARVGFVAYEDEADALRTIAVDQLAVNIGAEQWVHPRGITFRNRALREIMIGALFAGQGSQYVDMGLRAVLNIPPVATAFDDANTPFTDADRTLAQVVFPPPLFDPSAAAEQDATLTRTDYAQPAIGALAAGQFRFLTELGLRCDGFLGHSFGELTALWAAGALDDTSFFRLARARGLAMAPPADAAAFDPGTMAAVRAAREDVTSLLVEHQGVTVCNHNAPDQVVVGGGTADVDAFVARCVARGISAQRLPVAAAFHTPHVAHAVESFRVAVEATEIREPRGRTYANTAGASYGTDVAANRRVLVEQLVNPVEFAAGVEAMRADGCTVFVEFGPRKVLTGLVQRCLGEPDVIAIATDSGPTGDSDAALKQAAVRLAVLGVPLTGINRYAAEPFAEVVPAGMSIPLTGANHVPDAHRRAYREAIDNGYRVPPPVPAAAGAAAENGRTGHGPGTRPASSGDDISGGRPKVPARTSPAAAERIPAQASVPPPVLAPAVTQPSAQEAPVDQIAAVAREHLALHSQYLDSQLQVAGGLAAVLREPSQGAAADQRLHAAVEAVSTQSLAMSAAHIRVNEILTSLTELELGRAVAGPDGSGHHVAPAGEVENLAGVAAGPALAPSPAPFAIPAPTGPAGTDSWLPFDLAAPPIPGQLTGPAPANGTGNGSHRDADASAAPAVSVASAPVGADGEQVRSAVVEVVA